MNFKQKIINELHHPVRLNFPRRPTILKGMHDLYQADLISIQAYNRLNKGYKYILILIDCFTKMLYATPIVNKNGKTVTDAMKYLISRNKLTFKHLQTDEGKEFFNHHFKSLMKKFKVNHYFTKSDYKASIIERAIKTILHRLYKMFSLRGSYKWVDLLPQIVRNYNNSIHRTIGMKPNQVNKTNEKLVLSRIKINTKPKIDRKPPRKFQLGDKVRISRYRHVFTKGYLPNFTNEVFEIHRILPTNPETYTG